MPKPVAVIDIGSNTIKLLVAQLSPENRIEVLLRESSETRLGKGLNAKEPRFDSEMIERAEKAVCELLNKAEKLSPAATRIVATSAVRDAVNRDEFTSALRKQTGIEPDVLTGEQEAEFIGKAIQKDPSIENHKNFYVFDLGGGSLEAIAFKNGQLQNVVSLPLGSVRIAEKCLENPKNPFSKSDEKNVREAVCSIFSESGFSFSLPPDAILIGTGGTFTISLSILAARAGKKLEDLPLQLSEKNLRDLLAEIGSKTFSERLEIPNLSAGRADVFPAALTIALAVSELAQKTEIHHSLFNLRYGVASEMLSQK